MRRLSESELIQVVAEMERRYRQEMGSDDGTVDRNSVESPLPMPPPPEGWEDSAEPKSADPLRESGVVVLRTRSRDETKPKIVPGDEQTISGLGQHPNPGLRNSSANNRAVAYQPVGNYANTTGQFEDTENATVNEIPHVHRTAQYGRNVRTSGAHPIQNEQTTGYNSGVRPIPENYQRTPAHAGWLDKRPEHLSFTEIPTTNQAISTSQSLSTSGNFSTIGNALYNRPASTDSLQIPSLLGTRFHLKDLLGKGRLGRLFLADDMDYGGQYAVRLLNPWITQPEEMLEGFAKSFKSLEQMRHPSIAKVFFMGPAKEPNTLFYSMEYIEGKTLEQLQAAQKPFQPEGHPAFSAEDAFFFLEKICDVLVYAHDRDVVHGDLKANNIILVEGKHGRELRLMDFGLTQIATKARSPQLQANQTAQFFYTAPDDQTGGKELSPATDVFSLGVLFYRMLTGLLPAGWVISPSQVNKSLPTELDGIFQKAMHPDRQQRYGSVDELYLAVRNVLKPGSYPTDTFLKPPSLPEVPAKPSLSVDSSSVEKEESTTNEMDTFFEDAAGETLTVDKKLVEAIVAAGGDGSETNLNVLEAQDELLDPSTDAELSDLPDVEEIKKTAASPILTPETEASLEISWETHDSDPDPEEEVIDSSAFVAELLSGEFDEMTADLFDGNLEDDMIFGEPSFIPEPSQGAASQDALRRLSQSILNASPPEVQIEAKELQSSHRVISLNHMAVVEEMACSPNGRTLLTIDQELMIRLWDTQNWKLLHAIPKDRGSVQHLCWSPNSRQFGFCSSARTVDVWDATKCKQIHSIEFDADIQKLAWLANEPTMAVVCSDNSIHLWDVEVGKQKAILEDFSKLGHVFAYQPTCSVFLSGNNLGHVQLLPLDESEEPTLLHQSDHVITALAAAQRLPLLLCGDSNGEISFWDLNLNSQLYSMHEHAEPIFGVGINDEGTQGYSIDESGLVLVYDLTKGKILFQHQIEAEHDSLLSIEPRGRWLASSKDQNVNIWSIS